MVPVTKHYPSHLPDLCLLNVFKRVPLGELLRSVRVVCSNWRRMALAEAVRRRVLVLIKEECQLDDIRRDENPFDTYPIGELMLHVQRDDGSPWVRQRSLEQIRFNALHMPKCLIHKDGSLTEPFTTALMGTLPGITHLTAMLGQEDRDSMKPMLQQITRLLNHYRTSLVWLKLDISLGHGIITHDDDNDIELATNATALYDSINRLQLLRHLTFGVRLSRVNMPTLSILSQLDTFKLGHVYQSWVPEMFAQYASTGRVRIDWDHRCYSLDDMMLRFGPVVAPKLINANISCRDLTVAQSDKMRLFCSRFVSLTRMKLIDCTMPLAMIARCLSPLTQLVFLNLAGKLQLPDEDQPEPALYAPLASVRLLRLEIVTRSHRDTERLHLAKHFPNLQVLSFGQKGKSCVECDYAEDQLFDVEHKDRISQCVRLARQPFLRCVHLHSIKHSCVGHFSEQLLTREQF